MDNASKFLEAFVSIEQSMRDILKLSRYMKFYQMVNLCAKNNQLIRSKQSDLMEYAELRNAIVHQRGNHQEIIAQPVDSVVNDIVAIAQALKKDEQIGTYLHQKVVVCHPDDLILDVFYLMQKLDTSKLPIYDKDRFIGLLTYKEIAKWAIDRPNLQFISEIMGECVDDRIVFMDRRRNISHIINEFENALKKGNYLKVVIITEDGLKNQKPLGIFTAYDLPRLMAYLS
ncbi:MAG: CBS domain-containing protein [Erysipelotrichaceae bacterium]|nr:CBS domain-containing protein [Erysipelotrichaceae bacterium]MDY5252873.1 CBS domain-containing protein [Erysipelotrichaceae bacterium]